MTREELLKMSKKDLKNRLAELGKNAQTLSGQELTDAMDEARTIGEILDEIKGREELVAAAKAAGAEDPDEGDGAGEGSEEPQDQERAKRGKTLKLLVLTKRLLHGYQKSLLYLVRNLQVVVTTKVR